MKVKQNNPASTSTVPASRIEDEATKGEKLDPRISTLALPSFKKFNLMSTLPNIPKNRKSFWIVKSALGTINNIIRLVLNRLFQPMAYKTEYIFYYQDIKDLNHTEPGSTERKTMERFLKQTKGLQDIIDLKDEFNGINGSTTPIQTLTSLLTLMKKIYRKKRSRNLSSANDKSLKILEQKIADKIRKLVPEDQQAIFSNMANNSKKDFLAMPVEERKAFIDLINDQGILSPEIRPVFNRMETSSKLLFYSIISRSSQISKSLGAKLKSYMANNPDERLMIAIKHAQETFDSDPNLSVAEKGEKLLALKIALAEFFDPNEAGNTVLAEYKYAEGVLSDIRAILSEKLLDIAPDLIASFNELASAANGDFKILSNLQAQFARTFFIIKPDFNITIEPALEAYSASIESFIRNNETAFFKEIILNLTNNPELKLFPSDEDTAAIRDSLLHSELAENIPNLIETDALWRSELQFPGEDSALSIAQRSSNIGSTTQDTSTCVYLFQDQIDTMNSKSNLNLSEGQVDILTRLILGCTNQNLPLTFTGTQTIMYMDASIINKEDDYKFIIDVTSTGFINIRLEFNTNLKPMTDQQYINGYKTKTAFAVQIDPKKIPDSLGDITDSFLLDSGCISIGQHPTHMAYSTADN